VDCGIVGRSQKNAKNNEVYSAKHTHTQLEHKKTFPSPHTHTSQMLFIHTADASVLRPFTWNYLHSDLNMNQLIWG